MKHMSSELRHGPDCKYEINEITDANRISLYRGSLCFLLSMRRHVGILICEDSVELLEQLFRHQEIER